MAPPGTGSALTTGGLLLASSGQRPGLLSKVLPAQESLHHVVIWPKHQCGCRSVPQSCPTLCDPMDCSTPGFPVLHRLLDIAQTHVRWVSDVIQPSYPVVPFISCLQSFPALGSFPMNWLFTSGGQKIGVSASASVLRMNIQD